MNKWLNKVFGQETQFSQARRDLLTGAAAVILTEGVLGSLPTSEAIAAEGKANALYAAAENNGIISAFKNGSKEHVLKAIELLPSVHDVITASPEDQKRLLGVLRPPSVANGHKPHAWPSVGVRAEKKASRVAGQKETERNFSYMNGVPVMIGGQPGLLTCHSRTASTVAGNFEGLDNMFTRGYDVEVQQRTVERNGARSFFADVVPIPRHLIMSEEKDRIAVSIIGYTLDANKKFLPAAHAGVAWKLSQYAPLRATVEAEYQEVLQERHQESMEKQGQQPVPLPKEVLTFISKYINNCWAVVIDIPEGEALSGTAYPGEAFDGATVVVTDPKAIPQRAPFAFLGIKTFTIFLGGKAVVLVHGPSIMQKMGID